jgi:hypothetical protein
MGPASVIKVRMLRRIGFLWHFGHFFHDFLMPMNDYLETARPDRGQKMHVVLFGAAQSKRPFDNYAPRLLKRDDFLGDFKHIAEKFLNIEVRYEYGMPFEKRHKRPVRLRAYNFGPYSPESFIRLNRTADLVYGPSICNKNTPVILIERGHKPLAASRSGHEWTMTGSAIRSISNHSMLRDAMQARYGDNFANVVLESLSFEEQIALFRGAKIIVGQHGAGLCNIAWVARRGATVLELPPVRFATFQHMCEAKGLDYKVIYKKWVKQEPAPCPVDVDQVMSLLPDLSAF